MTQLGPFVLLPEMCFLQLPMTPSRQQVAVYSEDFTGSSGYSEDFTGSSGYSAEYPGRGALPEDFTEVTIYIDLKCIRLEAWLTRADLKQDFASGGLVRTF